MKKASSVKMKDRDEKERELQQFYFRVKRHKSTLFVTANGSDKVSQLKKEIIKQLSIDVKIKLYRADNSNPPNFTSLESQNGEDTTIAKLGLIDEQILYLVFWDDKN
ncbi:27164_t:CDS:2, partial [Dentiscutata erythropus]